MRSPCIRAPPGFVRRGQLLRGDGGEQVAHHRDPPGPDIEHVVPVGASVRRSTGRGRRPHTAFGLTHPVVRRSSEERPPSHCPWPYQVPQRLRDRPLAVHRDIHAASRHRLDALEGPPRSPRSATTPRAGRPGPLARRSERPGKRRSSSASTSGTTSTPFTQQPAALLQEPRRVDLRTGDVDAPEHGAAQVGPDEPGVAQVLVGERPWNDCLRLHRHRGSSRQRASAVRPAWHGGARRVDSRRWVPAHRPRRQQEPRS